MTVAELIERLKQFPPDSLTTYIDGENGRTDITVVQMEPDHFHSELEVLVIR